MSTNETDLNSTGILLFCFPLHLGDGYGSPRIKMQSQLSPLKLSPTALPTSVQSSSMENLHQRKVKSSPTNFTIPERDRV